MATAAECSTSKRPMLWDKNVASSVPGSYFPMWKNPGEYEIKVLRNGKLARNGKILVWFGL